MMMIRAIDLVKGHSFPFDFWSPQCFMIWAKPNKQSLKLQDKPIKPQQPQHIQGKI